MGNRSRQTGNSRQRLDTSAESAIRSARFAPPALFTLGGLNAWVGQTVGDYLAVSTGLCVCVCACAAGLFGEDLLQRDYRADRVVLAYVATHPDATTRQVARAIRVSQRRATRHLDRLTDDGLLTVASVVGHRALCTYRLALAIGQPKQTLDS
ncbi:helix-turn-helix domain-containing protein [Streptomyces globisporus]|uniref:MarR family transcriptional regulator n=1 Tax=Streptomyces globisporus TaxID=1908 RepID=UPI000D12881D|nr:helix-turn-helix domain-containing protein [Streptomyces globisporus]